MKNKKVVYVLITGIILCIILVVCGIVLLEKNKEEWPPDDIYVYNSSGYMAFEEDEEIKINLLLCSLHQNGKNPMEKYRFMHFVTDTGTRYLTPLDQNLKDTLLSDENYSQSLYQFPLYGDFKKGEKLNFTSIVLQDLEGKERILEFGNITIEILEDSMMDDKIMVGESSVYIGILDQYKFYIENNTQSDLLFNDIYLGGNDIQYSVNSAKILANGNKNFIAEIEEPDTLLNTPSFYVLKPYVILQTIESDKILCTSGPTMYYKTLSDEEVRKYLLDFQSKE